MATPLRDSPVPFPTLIAGVPPPPSPHLDPYLDAAARCFARHGVGRSSVQDVARELGVNRTTVYRQIGNVDAIVRLLLARDLYRFLISIPSDVSQKYNPTAFIKLFVAVVQQARAHPVLAKVMRDEPELIGPFLVAELPALIGRVGSQIVPLLRWAMDEGTLARRNPQRLADWLVRAAVTLILAPPNDDLEEFLAEVLVPVLSPPRSRR